MNATELKNDNFSDTQIQNKDIKTLNEKTSEKSVREPLIRLTSGEKAALIIASFWGGMFFSDTYISRFGGFYPLIFWGAFLLVSVTLLLKNRNASLKRPMFILSAAALLAASGRWIIYSSYETKNFIFPLLPFLGIFTLYCLTHDFKKLDLRPYTDTMISAFIGSFANVPEVFRTFLHKNSNESEKFRGRSGSSVTKQILTGIVIAAPLSLFAIMLLTQGDLDFRLFIEASFRAVRFPGMAIARIPLGALLGIYYLGLIHSVTSRSRDMERVTEQSSRITYIPYLTSLTVMTILNVIYLVYTYVQFRVFFSNGILAKAQSVSQFAREGFFSLLLVMVLNGLILTILKTFTDNRNRSLKAHFFFTWVFTMALIVLSNLKMTKYDSIYGYTHLRILVKISLIFFAVSMVFILIYILKDAFNPMKHITAAGLITIMIISGMNLDGMIAKKSLEIYKTRGENFDVEYLSNLSPDAYNILANQFSFGTSKDLIIQKLQNNIISNFEMKKFSLKDSYHDPLYLSLTEKVFLKNIEPEKGIN